MCTPYSFYVFPFRYRFYPGVAAPAHSAIGAGSGWAAEAIPEPPPSSSEMDLGSAAMDARASKTSRYRPANVSGPAGGASGHTPPAEAAGARERLAHRRAKGLAARAPRVTGSFDHALLPMPPVSARCVCVCECGGPDDLFFPCAACWIEADGYPCDGFSLVLCDCGE